MIESSVNWAALILHRLRKKNTETPYVARVSLLEGHVSPGKAPQTELGTVVTERWYTAPGVQRTEIRHDGIVGTLFMPPGESEVRRVHWQVSGRQLEASPTALISPAGPGPFPAMLDMWGMGGGLMEYRAALFASRGYATLALAYIGHKDLPGDPKRINVGNSYFRVGAWWGFYSLILHYICDMCRSCYFLKINFFVVVVGFCFVFLCSQHSICSRTTLRSVLIESGSLASPSASTWLSVLQLNLMLLWVCLCHPSVRFMHILPLETH